MERVFTCLFVGVVMLAIAAILLVSSASKEVSVEGIWIAAFLGLGTMVFVLAGRARRARVQNAANVRPNLLGVPLLPSGRERRIFFAAGALCFYALAYASTAAPKHAAGRWAWLISWFYDTLGPFGPAVLFAIIGTLFVAAAMLVRDSIRNSPHA